MTSYHNVLRAWRLPHHHNNLVRRPLSAAYATTLSAAAAASCRLSCMSVLCFCLHVFVRAGEVAVPAAPGTRPRRPRHRLSSVWRAACAFPNLDNIPTLRKRAPCYPLADVPRPPPSSPCPIRLHALAPAGTGGSGLCRCTGALVLAARALAQHVLWPATMRRAEMTHSECGTGEMLAWLLRIARTACPDGSTTNRV